MTLPDLMSKEQVMEGLGGISESTFKRLCWAGELERVYPRYNIMRVTRESYLAYLESVKARTTQPKKGTPYGSSTKKGVSTGQRSSARVGQMSTAYETSAPSQSLGSKVRSLFGFKGPASD